jgi:endonuclease/exonuclease/phosphatase family metal-dependent hydrolase
VQGRHDAFALKHTTNWTDQAQHEFLAGATQHSAYGLNAQYDHGHHGNALLSNFPIASSRNQDISDHAYESRGILHCVVETPAGPVHCYVVHLGLFAGSRKRQCDALVEAVKSSAPNDEPVIIAGDFNDWGNQLSENLRKTLGVMEVFDERVSKPGIVGMLRRLGGRPAKVSSGRTFPVSMPFLQLDRMYVRGFSVESAEVLRGAAWSKLSDHLPIVATLNLK